MNICPLPFRGRTQKNNMEENIKIEVCEPESGECTKMQFTYSPNEHPQFDEAIGTEIYSWISLWMDQIEESGEST